MRSRLDTETERAPFSQLPEEEQNAYLESSRERRLLAVNTFKNASMRAKVGRAESIERQLQRHKVMLDKECDRLDRAIESLERRKQLVRVLELELEDLGL